MLSFAIDFASEDDCGNDKFELSIAKSIVDTPSFVVYASPSSPLEKPCCLTNCSHIMNVSSLTDFKGDPCLFQRTVSDDTNRSS